MMMATKMVMVDMVNRVNRGRGEAPLGSLP